VLASNHRQEGDKLYAELLERVRLGGHRAEDIEEINATWDLHTDAQRLHMPQLRALRDSVESYNSEQLELLDGEAKVFEGKDDCLTDVTREEAAEAATKLNRSAPRQLLLKCRAPVIATRRLSPIIPTGTVGLIVALPSSDSVVCSFKGKIVTVTRVDWETYNIHGKVTGRRQQLPLLLAWAVTIHRAQGSELERVCIDFSMDNWACDGLVYTALSCVRTLESLCVRGLSMLHIKTNAACLNFWRAVAQGTNV